MAGLWCWSLKVLLASLCAPERKGIKTQTNPRHTDLMAVEVQLRYCQGSYMLVSKEDKTSYCFFKMKVFRNLLQIQTSGISSKSRIMRLG